MSANNSWTRRQLVQVGTLGWTGLTLSGALAAADRTAAHKPRAKSCILLYLDGGPSHIDLLDMKPGAPREIRGPYSPITSTVPGLQVCEHLPNLARQMHLCTLIRSVCHEQTVHDPAVYQMLTGYRHISTAGGLKVEADDVPHMAAAFSRVNPIRAAMPAAIELPETMHMDGRVLPGQNGGFLGVSYDPFRVRMSIKGEVGQPEFLLRSDIATDRLVRRSSLLSELIDGKEDLGSIRSDDPGVSPFDAYRHQALDILRSPQVGQAFALDQESSATRDLYGRHRHGQSALLARRLVEAGARFVTVYWGREDQDWADGRGARPANNPWDTHRNHFPLVQQSLLPRADQTLAALLQDLERRGLLDETLVVWMSDFGRTPRISQPWASRDHWPHAFSVILAGAGLPQGFIYGKTDQHAAYVTENPVSPADLTATLFNLLGVNPQTTIPGPKGLPHAISNGAPIDL
ncbi:MAG: hypothetical protein JWM11_1713 [Planctomycetaceae bacterium]|nr:hypothetical protein [Planctomycetaceae bacterium]